MPRPEKVTAVEEIAGRFRDSNASLLTEYRGLSVSEIAEVRRALRQAGADYKVLKNTLTRIAARQSGLDDLVGFLQGPTAIAFVKGDAVEAARVLDEAATRFPVLVVKGGVLDGTVIDAGRARELARLEPRDVQLSKIAMLLASPLQQTANVLSASLRDLASMLAQVLQAKEEEPEPTTQVDAPPEETAGTDEESLESTPAVDAPSGEPEEQSEGPGSPGGAAEQTLENPDVGPAPEPGTTSAEPGGDDEAGR